MKTLPATALALLLAACGGGGADDTAVSSGPAPVPPPAPVAQAPAPASPAPAPAPVAQTPPPAAQPPAVAPPVSVPTPAAPGAPQPPAASPPPAESRPTPEQPGPQQPSPEPEQPSRPVDIQYETVLQCGQWGIGWIRDHVGPGEPVRPEVPMYPVRFRINYTSVMLELLEFGFPEPNDPFVTSPVVRVDTDEKGELWTVPDPKIWVGDSVYGFKNGALVYALQMTGSAAYTYLQCGEW